MKLSLLGTASLFCASGILMLSGCQSNGVSSSSDRTSSTSEEPSVITTASGRILDRLNLSTVATMGLADEQGYDGRGGWFDQGPKNDLSGFPTGDVTLAGVPFHVTDPTENAGKAVLILKGGNLDVALPGGASIAVDDPNASGYLYLLHSAGWVPSVGAKIGQVTIIYRDGSQDVRMIRSGVDVADWYDAHALSNGVVAWSKPARGGYHGIYVSLFRTKNQPIAAISFRSEKNAAWAILGATLSNVPLDLPLATPVTIQAGKEWVPFSASLDVNAGSALDMSWMLDAPAGKYGAVTARDGHFYFENAPEQRIRFYGTNLCYSANFPSHAEAENLASRLASMGYNVVRFHHFDGMLTENGKDSLTFDPDRLDRLEYLMAQCQKRGMYLVIDLFSYREIRAGEIPEIDGPVLSGFKALPPVLESAMNNWKTYARRILTHKNPYTGLTLAENPALVGICPVNEDPLGTVWHDSPALTEFFNKRLEAWKTQHGIVTGNHDEEQAAASRYLNEIQNKGEAMYADYLHNELHVHTPLTGANCLVAISLTEPRSRFDYVDNHIYWDHPSFPGAPWSLPYSYSQMSAVRSGAFAPRTMFPTRIVGKPFTVTEWNYCNPNRYRAEGTALMTAYAGFQDWDGLYRFAHSHNIDNVVRSSAGNGFDMSTDPMLQLTERVGALMFLRGDVAPAKGMVTYAVDASNGYRVTSSWGAEGYEEPVELLGLCTGVGSVWAEGMAPDSLPEAPLTGSSLFASRPGYVAPDAGLLAGMAKAGVIPADSFDTAGGIYKSDTGQIALDSKDGTFVVSTERGDWFVSNRPTSLKGANASIDIKNGPTTVGVVSLDGKSLSESGRILVIHVTEQYNSGAKFSAQDLQTLEDWGQLPHLMHAGKATLSFSTDMPLKAFSLDMTGRRVAEVPLCVKDGTVSIDLDISAGREAVLAYELVAE